MSPWAREALAWAGTAAAIVVLPLATAVVFIELQRIVRWLLAGAA
jgi:hypothetical protein